MYLKAFSVLFFATASTISLAQSDFLQPVESYFEINGRTRELIQGGVRKDY